MRNRVVELKAGKKKGWIELVFEDGGCMIICREAAEAAGVHSPGDIDLDYLNRVIKEQDYKRGFEAALNYLEFRQRSEAEVRQYLKLKQKCHDESTQLIINKLRTMGLIDDRVFAETWMLSRTSYKPKSRLMIKRELLQKGIDYDIANDVTEDVDDEASAYKAGMKKAKLLRNAGQAEFSKRLTAYLARRGFGGDVVRTTVSKLWKYIRDD